jgi:membrane protease YdiL (CAAX protease family)
MTGLRDGWLRMPVVIRAVVVGMLAAAAGTYPWAWLAAANMRTLSSVPWGPLIMVGYLWLYWKYATGRGWPASTALARHESARARTLDGSIWAKAIVAGFFGLWFSVALMRLIGRFVVLPAESPADLSRIPPLTLVALAIVGALVAGVVEEISFRGYMQRPIEQRHGPVMAIIVVGVMFGLAHGGHTYWSLALMPYYVAVAAVYGELAYLTDSILPSLVLHASGNALDALLAVAGNGESAARAAAPHGAGPAGPSLGLWINVFVLAATAVAAIWAYRALAIVVRRTRPIQEQARAGDRPSLG